MPTFHIFKLLFYFENMKSGHLKCSYRKKIEYRIYFLIETSIELLC